jgi:hypothetical protein
MTLDEVVTLIRDIDRFKFNCNLVIIDFLTRHGQMATTELALIEQEMRKAFL